MGVCCRIGVCCPPGSPEQVADLAEWLAEGETLGSDSASYQEIAGHVLDSYRLVPRSIEAGPLGASERDLAIANRLLERINEMVSHQLETVLELAGHPTEE